MINPLNKNNLYATPKNPKAFEEYLMSLSGQERVIAMTAASMAWNLASDIVDLAIHTEEFNKETE